MTSLVRKQPYTAILVDDEPAFRNSAFDYLLKPVNTEELAHLVTRLESFDKVKSANLVKKPKTALSGNKRNFIFNANDLSFS